MIQRKSMAPVQEWQKLTSSSCFVKYGIIVLYYKEGIYSVLIKIKI